MSNKCLLANAPIVSATVRPALSGSREGVGEVNAIDGDDSDNDSADWDALFDGKIMDDGVDMVKSDGNLETHDGGARAEGVRPKSGHRPTKPSKAEVAEHEFTHILHRDWRSICRRGSGRCGPHRSNTADDTREVKENTVGTFYVDYTYVIDNGRWLKHEDLEAARKKV